MHNHRITLKHSLLRAFAAFLALTAAACSGGKENTAPEFNVSGIVLPEQIQATAGGSVELKVMGGHGPLVTDKVELAGPETFMAEISEVGASSFTFILPEAVFSGDYVFSIVRGAQSKRVGKTKILVTGGVEIDPEGATVYGLVSARGKGVEGVVVSDGVEVTVTDAQGIYRLSSQKKHGYVFMSVPSGYEALNDGILPLMHKTLVNGPTDAERVDFSLTPVEGQDDCTVLLFGDIHLAKRTGDRDQFEDFVSDVNSYLASATGKVYGITLGDMTWNLYWIVNGYGFKEYLQDANRIKNLIVFHTIGNHDHSIYYTGDFDTVAEYKRLVAPTYYSFNIGKVHYIVLDDIECTNRTATTDDKGNACYEQDYNGNVVNEQFTWLQKDLSYVSANTPLVLMMHVPLNNEDGTLRLTSSNRSKLEAIFAAYPKTHVFTGHTHRVYNIDRMSGKKYFEHNAGAVCGTWWWSGYITPGIHIGQDGSPGGYMVMKVKGEDFSWQFKATGSGTDYQFRTYDRNNIHISADKYLAGASSASVKSFDPGRWSTASSANEVYVNVWNYDPSWKVEVFEGSTALGVSQLTEMDPLHLISYTAPRLKDDKVATFATQPNTHMFKVTASSASSTLTVRVTDGFGNVYKETMERPKRFDISTYEK